MMHIVCIISHLRTVKLKVIPDNTFKTAIPTNPEDGTLKKSELKYIIGSTANA